MEKRLSAAHPDSPARWLELHEGGAPILLIAPHGGSAGPDSHRTLHPKVNDLHTADITRELARRLGATAIINAAMDRNRLDCNRLTQVIGDAPWLLEIVAQRVERIVARHSRAVVAVIHGWNVIEPRVDVGVGLRLIGGALRPARGAHVSASDGFINGALANLSRRLRVHGIEPTFGLRYPGGAAHNLLQAFTPRFAESPVDPLRRLAALAARGALEAVQLELSVALRLPGKIRAHGLDAIAAALSEEALAESAQAAPPAMANRGPAIIRVAAATRPKPASQPPPAMPQRAGIEFYDPRAGIGVMASFDIGGAARVMAIIGRCQIALFTAEGATQVSPAGLRLGPISLIAAGDRLRLAFRGPAVIVDDGTAYLSVERALASASLHDMLQLEAEFQPWTASGSSESAAVSLARLCAGTSDGGSGRFGRVTGNFTIGGATLALDAVARLGGSFAGLGARPFDRRRMVWAAVPDSGAIRAVELRDLAAPDGQNLGSATIHAHDGPIIARLDSLAIEQDSSETPPRRIEARFRPERDGQSVTLGGSVGSFVMLSRPGLEGSRIHTTLGFASLRIGAFDGAGMFELSRRVGVHGGLAGSDEPEED